MAETEKINIGVPFVMNLDGDPATLRDGECTFMLNAVPAKDGSGKPYRGNAGATDLKLKYPSGYLPLESINIGREERCVFLVNSATSNCQIGIVRDDQYTMVVEDPRLNFSVLHQIQAKSKRMFNGHRIIYFTDWNESMRNMDLDSPPMINGVLDIDQLKVFKNYDVPEINIVDITNNGQLKTGGYMITGQYADGRGNGLTACFKLTPKVPIFRDSISDPYETITGNVSSLITNKAIKIRIANPDISFTHINIIVIQQIDGAYQSFKVATIPVQQEEYIYSGAGTEIPQVLEEVLAPATVYETARTVEESDGSLVWGNLKGKKPINFQPFVNQVMVQWLSVKAKARHREVTLKNPLFAAYKASYRRDEVVPLALVFQLKDGTESNPHPLIGRALDKRTNGQPFSHQVDNYGQAINPAKWDSEKVVINKDVYEGVSMERWRMQNTATVEGTILPAGQDEGLAFYGEMAYHESTDRYPNNVLVWGALAGQPMRFPKMPDSSVLHIHDGENGSRTYDQEMYLYHLGITLPNIDQVINSMPQEIKDQIKGWRVVRADRRFDKSILASGMLFNCWEQDFRSRSNDPEELRLYANYPLNDLRQDPYLWKAPKASSNPLVPLPTSNVPNNRYRKDCFTFLSPDTTLNRTPLSNSELKINAELYGQGDCFHAFLDPYPNFKEHDDKNTRAALFGIAVGSYNNYKKVRNGEFRRQLSEAMYIPAGGQVGGGNAGRPVWNKGRDATVLLKTSDQVADPTVQDRSRFILDNSDNPGANEGFTANQDGDEGGLTAHVKRPVSAYYATIKRNVPNQYGSLSNIKWVDTGWTDKMFKAQGIILGGDSYICMFTSKRTMPFYTDIQKWMLAETGMSGANFNASNMIPGVKYYYKNTGGNPRNNSNMLLKDGSGWFLGDDKDLGFLTMYMDGVPVFWAEADVNTDLRYEGDATYEAIYPSLLNGGITIQEWLNVQNMDKDNAYYHNSDLSGGNELSPFSVQDPLFDPNNTEAYTYFSRAIKSQRSQPEDVYDNWQIYKPLDYYDFPKSSGQMVDIRYLGNRRTIFRFEETMYITQLLQVLNTSGDSVFLGSGRLFAQDPTDPIRSDVQYTGTRSQWAFDLCEFGAFCVNSERGKVFNIAEGIKDITADKYNVANWFLEHLPFRLSRYLPNIDIDNPYNPEGIGLFSTYDPKNKLWILTKKDYEPVNANIAARLNINNGTIYDGAKAVSVKDRMLFRNCSFTIAYSPEDNGWLTFYSFVPDMYENDGRGFQATVFEKGIASVHVHNNTRRFNNFYGRKVPFIVEYATRADGITTMVHSHSSFITHAMETINNVLVATRARTFNKAVVSNDVECTGTLNLVVQDENDLSTLYQQLTIHTNSKDVALRPRDGHWNFSDYFNIAIPGKPVFTDDWNNADFRNNYPIDKVVNNAAMDYTTYLEVSNSLRSQVTKTRLMLEGVEDLKLLFQVGIDSERNSYS